MNASSSQRTRAAISIAATVTAVTSGAIVAGALVARAAAPTLHSRYFPWITGRALGIASYLSLTALVLLGVWMRHPWRFTARVLRGESRIRAHAVLGVATVVLVAGHLVALAADRYAGVGWWGALVPGMSHYRTLPVALGVVALLAVVLVGASAGLAGRRGTGHWLAVHRFSAATFAVVWLHGLFAGTDARALRPVYVATGVAVLAAVTTRYAARPASVEVARAGPGLDGPRAAAARPDADVRH